MDLCIIITLYGVCVTYLITATQLLVDTPITLRCVLHANHRSSPWTHKGLPWARKAETFLRLRLSD